MQSPSEEVFAVFFPDELVQLLDVFRMVGVADKGGIRRVDDDEILTADGRDQMPGIARRDQRAASVEEGRAPAADRVAVPIMRAGFGEHWP